MIDLGDPWPNLSTEVKDSAGALANATTVTLTLTASDGTVPVNAVTVAPTSTGVYEYTYVPTMAGHWAARWVATGTNASAFTDSVDVDESAPSGIVSLGDVKAHLNIKTADHDEELRLMVDAASEWVESRIGPVVRRTYADVVWAAGNVLLLNHAPVLSLTSIAGAYGYTDTYTVGSVYLDAAAGVVRLGTSTTWTTSPLTVTYVAGRAVVPPAVRLATLMYVKGLWETQRGPATPVGLLQGVEDTAELPGMGLAVWRAEKLLEPFLSPPAVA